jgi:two-component system, OmpR family, heavy metal sensor histidine kinase CusS
MSLKFRNRIALFTTLAVALITALVFVVIYTVVHHTAYAHLDHDILQEKEEVINNLDWKLDSIIIHKMPEWEEAEHSKVEVNPTFLQIVDLNGKVIFHSSNLLHDQFLYGPDIDDDFFFNSELSLQKIRLGQFPLKNDAGKIIGHLTIAISRQESYTVLHNLVLVLILSFPIVLVILFFASSVAASKAIEPLMQLIRTASGITDATIGTRLLMPMRKDEFYDLTQTINDLLGRIEESMMRQKQFTSDASHEIRTPLAAIRGTLEVLIRKPREPEKYQEKIAGVIQQVDRLGRLLDQLLELARIESGISKPKHEPVPLQALVSGLNTKWKEAVKAKGITISINIPEGAIVTCDKLFLEIILDNLVHNAIKYGKDQGHILVHWDEGPGSLAVRDDGYGIPAEHLPNIFSRFYRVDPSRSSNIQGSGLGLSIVKKLADLQSISLVAQSIPGEGTVFTMSFPG